MEIRPPDASERDAEIDEAARLWAAYEANRPGAPHDPLYGESQRRGFVEYARKDSAVLLLAVNPEGVVGCVLGEVSEERSTGSLAYLVADPVQRRVGIGRALVGAFVAACQEQGVGALSLTVHETNAEAQRLYEATGWRWNASETVTTPVGDEVLRVMRLVL